MPAVRPSAAGQFEGWILTQMVEIIAVFIAAADRENASTDDAAERMCHPVWITLVREQTGKPFDDPDTLLRQGQQRHASIR